VTHPSPAEIERALERAWDLLDGGEPRRAAELLRPLLARGVRDAGDAADLHHLLGIACEEAGDRAGMVAEWLETLRLDRASDGPRELGDAELAAAIDDALDELPDEIVARLANVPIIADERPSTDLVRDGTDPRLLGLFHGLPLGHESQLGPAYAGTIHLFFRNLERESADADELRRQIRVTVLHETAHFVGLDEDDLHRLGLE
jgi:predicted Zn-dependent protease with MMP-like domain